MALLTFLQRVMNWFVPEHLSGDLHTRKRVQMFIVSHVEDVQQSPVMNEAWTITEREGSSHVERPSFFGGPHPGD